MHPIFILFFFFIFLKLNYFHHFFWDISTYFIRACSWDIFSWHLARSLFVFLFVCSQISQLFKVNLTQDGIHLTKFHRFNFRIGYPLDVYGNDKVLSEYDFFLPEISIKQVR